MKYLKKFEEIQFDNILGRTRMADYKTIEPTEPKKYVTLEEDNEWEGETWRYHIEATPEALEQMENIDSIMKKYHLPFEVDLEPKTQEEVDALVKHASMGYMNSDSIGEIDDFKYQVLLSLAEGKNPKDNGLDWYVSLSENPSEDEIYDEILQLMNKAGILKE